MTRKPLIRLCSLSIILPLINACGVGDAGVPAQAIVDEPLPIAVEAVRVGPIEARYPATGHLEAEAHATVVARIDGEVLEILVEEGQEVDAGQALARLDRTRLELEQRKAQARLAKLVAELERQQALHERKLVSPRDFEDLRYEVEIARATHRLVALELSYATLRAPIAGTVSARLIKPGNRLAAGMPAFEITDLTLLQSHIHVPQSEIALFAPGQAVELAADALPGMRFGGRILRISPIVDARSGTAKITVELVDRERQLRPGMFMRLGVTHERRDNAILVPLAAVDREDTEASVWVAVDGSVHKRPVELGIVSDDWVEVRSGLAAGERIAVSGVTGLREGTRVVAEGMLSAAGG